MKKSIGVIILIFLVMSCNEVRKTYIGTVKDILQIDEELGWRNSSVLVLLDNDLKLIIRIDFIEDVRIGTKVYKLQGGWYDNSRNVYALDNRLKEILK